MDHHSFRMSKLRVLNNKLISTLNFENYKRAGKLRRGYFGGCKLMRLHAFGESVLVVAGEKTYSVWVEICDSTPCAGHNDLHRFGESDIL